VPKKKLLLVVGAGASVDFGMPSVAAVRGIINSVIQTRYPLLNVSATNLYEHIEETISRYWAHFVPVHLRRSPHFEDVLYVIFALASAYPAGAYTSALGALITATKLPDVSFFSRKPQQVGSQILRDLGNASVDSVIENLRSTCVASKVSKAGEFAQLQAFVTALQADFDIAVVTLNYDDVMYRAFPGIETGFDTVTGKFDERRILNRSEWSCMLHLHGSVHFDMPLSRAPSSDLHEICWQPNLGATFQQNASGRNSRRYAEGTDFPTSVIVAGYGKTSQILRRPFRTYYSEIDRLVSSCDALLFAGYGFGDVHLNIAFETYRDTRRRPVAVIGWATDDAMTMGGTDLGDHNPVISTLIHTFRTELASMRALGHSLPDTVRALRTAEEFEVSINPDTPLALWYNGMIAACANPSKVIARLA
jgi:hypothetical protein